MEVAKTSQLPQNTEKNASQLAVSDSVYPDVSHQLIIYIYIYVYVYIYIYNHYSVTVNINQYQSAISGYHPVPGS